MSGEDVKRTFTISESSIGFKGGRYTSKTRAAAAKKAATRLSKMLEASNPSKAGQTITFSLRESTRGSDRKVTCYEGKRVPLKTPRTIKVPNPADPSTKLEIVYSHEVVVKACDE